jgi:hypothetical protein
VRAGVLAASILALAPFHVRFAQEARMYALLMLNVSLATLALTYLLADPRAAAQPLGRQLRTLVRSVASSTAARRAPRELPTTDLAWLAYMLFTAASVLTHSTAIFFPLATNIFVIGFILYRRNRPVAPSSIDSTPDFAPPAMSNWLWAQLGALLIWLPWSYAFVVQSMGVYNEFWIPAPTTKTVVSALRALLNDFLPQSISQVWAIWLGYAFLLALGALHLYKRPPILVFLLMLLLTPLLGELLVSLRRPIFYDRTLIWTTIPLYLLLAFGLLQLRRKVLIATGLILLCTVNLLSLQNYYQDFKKEEWREAAAHMAAKVSDGDLILFNATWVQIPFDYYFKRFGRPVAQHGVPVDLFGRGVLEPKMTEGDLPRLHSLLSDHDRVWLVYSHDWYTDPNGIIPIALRQELQHVDTQRYYGLQVMRYERRQ